MTAPERDVEGTWRLVAEELRTLDGSRSVYQRPPTAGLLTYTREGYVFWVRANLERASFASPDTTLATAAEWADAGSTFRCYAGRYRIDGTTMIHEVELSLFPNWSGRSLKRTFTLADGVLELSSEPFPENQTQVVGVLRFERVR